MAGLRGCGSTVPSGSAKSLAGPPPPSNPCSVPGTSFDPSVTAKFRHVPSLVTLRLSPVFQRSNQLPAPVWSSTPSASFTVSELLPRPATSAPFTVTGAPATPKRTTSAPRLAATSVAMLVPGPPFHSVVRICTANPSSAPGCTVLATQKSPMAWKS